VSVGGGKTGTVHIRFYAELGDLLPPKWRGRDIARSRGVGQTVKDLIEAMGVPHTEVDLLLVGGRSVAFGYRLRDGDRVSVYPVFEALDISSVSKVRSKPLRVTRFVADVHLGRLARYLRIVGFDTAYDKAWGDAELAELAIHEHRILLTRDRGLLKRAMLDHGYLVREQSPRAQLAEVVQRFDLAASLRPFTRCAVCNGEVRAVAKVAASSLVPARTSRHYCDFWRCECCGRVYWKGGHYRSLMALVAGIEGKERLSGSGAPEERAGG
jgi:uncharacterized protein